MAAPSGMPNIPKAEMEKMVLIGIMAFIIVFSLIQFGMVPSFRRLGDLKKEILKESDAFKKAQSLVANKSQLQARLSSMRGKLKDYEKALPPYAEMPNILEKIAEVAGVNKVKIIKIEPLRVEKPADAAKAKAAPARPGDRPDARKPASIYTEIPIQVEVKGGYHALGRFINGVESADNIMSIGDMEIKASPDDMQNHSARFLIVAYVLREEAPVK